MLIGMWFLYMFVYKESFVVIFVDWYYDSYFRKVEKVVYLTKIMYKDTMYLYNCFYIHRAAVKTSMILSAVVFKYHTDKRQTVSYWVKQSNYIV